MKTYVEEMLARFENVIENQTIEVIPRQLKPGDKVALAMLVKLGSEEEIMQPIYPHELDETMAIPPQHWENGHRPFDINCIFAEVTDRQTDRYEVKALLSPAIRAQYPDADLNTSPRFIAATRKEDMTWDYIQTDHFTWYDTPQNVNKYPYPVDLDNALYIDVELLLISIIGIEAMFKTTIRNIIRFFANYLDQETDDIEQWSQEINNRFSRLHHLTFLHTHTSHTLH